MRTEPVPDVAAEGRTLGRRHLVAIVAGVVVTGVSVALWPSEPRPLAALVVATGAVLCIRYVHLAAAGLAFIVSGNLSGVATNVHDLPSPSIALAAAIVIGIALRPDRWSFVPPPRLAILFGAYAFVVLVSFTWAGYPQSTLDTADILLREMVLAALVAVVVRRTGTLRLTLWAIVAATTLIATVSSIQYLTGTFTDDYLGLSEAVVANIVGGAEDWRIAGPIGDPNHYAQTLLIGLPIALTRAIHERRLLLRVVGVASTVILAFAVYTTFSRGGMLALVGVLLVLALLRRPRPSAVVAGLVATALVVAVLPADFRQRVAAAADVTALTEADGPEDIAVRGRLSEVLAGLAMFRDEPLLGVGAGNYPPYYQQYAQRFQLDRRPAERSAHSLYVEIAAETGIIGLIAFLALLLGLGSATRVAYRRAGDGPPPPEDRGLIEGLGLATLSFLLTSVLLHAAHARTFWVLAALILVLPSREDAGGTGVAVTRSTTRHLDGRAPTT